MLVIALLVFGPKKLPQMGHSLGQSISGFRKGMQDAKEEFSGVMKEGTVTAEPVQTAAAPATPLASTPILAEPSVVQPAVAQPGVTTAEQAPGQTIGT